MKIIRMLKEKLETGADIQIISFQPTDKKSGLDWLQVELKERASVLSQAVSIHRVQPVANATSMYLFDDKCVVFNRKSIATKTTYHVENYSNSIIHELLKVGIEKLRMVKR